VKSRRRPYYDAARYPELAGIRERWRDLGPEAKAVVDTLGTHMEKVGPTYVIPLVPVPEDRAPEVEWLYAKARELAPTITSLVSAVPYIVSFAISRLVPGTDIPIHEHWNPHLVAMLCLQGGAGCHVTVGGERRDFVDGEYIVFDYTLPHGSRNEGTEERIVLLMIIEPKLARPFMRE